MAIRTLYGKYLQIVHTFYFMHLECTPMHEVVSVAYLFSTTDIINRGV